MKENHLNCFSRLRIRKCYNEKWRKKSESEKLLIEFLRMKWNFFYNSFFFFLRLPHPKRIVKKSIFIRKQFSYLGIPFMLAFSHISIFTFSIQSSLILRLMKEWEMEEKSHYKRIPRFSFKSRWGNVKIREREKEKRFGEE